MRARAREALVAVLPAFVVAKMVTALAIIASLAQQGVAISWQSLRDAFLHWDALSYVDIAAHGYPGHLDYHDAFLPGYPLLMRGAAFLTQDLVAGGVLVNAIAELAALVAVLWLVRRERDDATARFAVWAVALLPLGFFFTGVYTESPFIAGAAFSLLLMRRGRFAAAAVAAALATSMRVTGAVLVPVMLFELWRQRRLRSGAPWLAVAALPLVLYGAYMRVRTGDALALVHAESLPSFGEAPAWPWNGLRLTWETAATSSDPTNQAIFVREIVAGLAGAVVVAAGWLDRRFPASFSIYCSLVWLLAVSLSFWRSVPRYDLALFPAVMVLADATRGAVWLRPALLLGSAAILVWGSVVFAQGGWIG